MKKTILAAAAGMLAMPFAGLIIWTPVAGAAPCPSNVAACQTCLNGAITPGTPAGDEAAIDACWGRTPNQPLTGPAAVCNQYQLPSDRSTCLDNLAMGRPPGAGI
jgi:hypothetical protein